MRRYRKWVLTLGIMAATPGITMAGPLSFLNFNKSTEATSQSRASGSQTNNQKVAEQIAGVLRAAKLKGHDIEIEFEKGTAKLTGMISDAQQKTKASQAVSRVPGVRKIDNQLKVMSKTAQGAKSRYGQSPVRPVQYRQGAQAQGSGVRQAGYGGSESSGPSNQEMAQKIADALTEADLSGYDVEIRYQNGVAMLRGMVGSAQQRMTATKLISEIEGVQRVDNQLQVPGRSGGPQGPIQSAGYQPMPPQGGPRQGGPQGGRPVPRGRPMPPQNGIPAPPSYGHPGSGASHQAYNMPHLPKHAWPSYASYPNYSQVSYPKQYSASAWPYIGPFYPYPQVPMGWRKAQLEWDDGYWNLDFDSKTDHWWWFMNPQNW